MKYKYYGEDLILIFSKSYWIKKLGKSTFEEHVKLGILKEVKHG